MTERITITMSEVVRYQREFTIDELAKLLDIPTDGVDPIRVRGNVLAALDPSNSNYGLAADSDDESLIDAMVPPGEISKYIIDVEDREWGIARLRNA